MTGNFTVNERETGYAVAGKVFMTLVPVPTARAPSTMEARGFKKAVKDFLARSVARLPWGFRQRIFEELLEQHTVPQDLRYDALVRLAASCQVQDFTVSGNQGPIRGSARAP